MSELKLYFTYAINFNFLKVWHYSVLVFIVIGARAGAE